MPNRLLILSNISAGMLGYNHEFSFPLQSKDSKRFCMVSPVTCQSEVRPRAEPPAAARPKVRLCQF